MAEITHSERVQEFVRTIGVGRSAGGSYIFTNNELMKLVALIEQETLSSLASAALKFAPDLAAELASRWTEQANALEMFLKFLNDPDHPTRLS